MNELLGFSFSDIDFEALLQDALAFAGPRLLQSLLQLLAAVVALYVARWILTRVQRRFADRTETRIDDIAVELIRRAVTISVAFWAAWRLGHIWDLPRVATFISAAWIVALTLPLSRALAELLKILEQNVVSKTDTRLDDTALPWVNRIISWSVIAMGVMIAAQQLNLSIAPLLAGASIAGVAISFAAKDTLSNLIAGILLIVDRPFEVGDRIEVWSAPERQANWGDVIEIGLRATKIRTPDNILIVIPNNEIMQRDIINYTASGPTIRLRIPIGIAYDADVELAKSVCLESAAASPEVHEQPEPVCILRAFGASSVDLELRVWLVDARQRRAVEDTLTEDIKKRFDAAGIEIPYPKRDIYIKTAPAGATVIPPADPSADPGAKS